MFAFFVPPGSEVASAVSNCRRPLCFPQAWTLSLLARCHVAAGEAVTAEGLFRAALDSLQGIAEEVDDGIARSQRPAGAVALPLLFASPLHPYTKAATLRGYSELLLQWEKREAEGEVVARQAEKVVLTYCKICASLRLQCVLISSGRPMNPLLGFF